MRVACHDDNARKDDGGASITQFATLTGTILIGSPPLGLVAGRLVVAVGLLAGDLVSSQNDGQERNGE
jgi:hypothetical protein